jgi:hypothetical protein
VIIRSAVKNFSQVRMMLKYKTIEIAQKLFFLRQNKAFVFFNYNPDFLKAIYNWAFLQQNRFALYF